MAHHVEPMDIDSDFDNKENSLHHNNVLPFTEKGYEELDVSELNMKLRYSVTPASSPMSKSYTASCLENRSLESGDDSLNVTVNENGNLSRSLNSTMTKNDNILKSLKGLPLQTIPTEQFSDSNRNTSILRSLESTITSENGNITVTVSGPGDIDENLSLPSSSSSALQTPEATTPTKDIPPKDGGSPIMRGLKSVLNMFRASQSPIPPADNENILKSEMLSPVEEISTMEKSQVVLASTPIAAHRKKEMSPTKRSSPQKDSSIIFNEDLEKELQWKDETTIIFSQERIPIHKLLYQQPHDNKNSNKGMTEILKQDLEALDSTVEYMDISYNDSIRDKTMTEIQTDDKKADSTFAGESDSEFVDCETTFTKNESQVDEDNDKTPVVDQAQDMNLTKEIENKNESGSRLKQIILDTTQDILDATLSVKPEDLLPEALYQSKDKSAPLINEKEATTIAKDITDCREVQEESAKPQDNVPIFDETVNITTPLTLETKAEDPNATKTIVVLSTTQPNDQTFDVPLIHDSETTTMLKEITDFREIHQESSVSQVNEQRFDQTLNIATLLALETKADDPNFTKTIEVLSATQPNDQTFDVPLTNNSQATTILKEITESREVHEESSKSQVNEPIFDQTLNITTPLMLETKEDDPNVTKTIEELSTTSPIDQTFDTPLINKTEAPTIAKENTDSGEIHEGSLKLQVNVPIFDETVNITNPLVLGTTTNDPNVTKTINVLSTTQPNDQTFDVTNSLINVESHKQNLDVTNTIENIIDQTQILESQDNQIMNSTVINETITLDNNKTFNASDISVLNDNNVNAIEIALDTQLNETKPIDSADSDDLPIKPIPSLASLEQAANVPYVPNEVTIKEAAMTKLPVDVPLPDEDDLDKELNIDIGTELSTPPVSLPLDLVDDIKKTPAAVTRNDITDIETEVIEAKVTETLDNAEFEKIVQPEACSLDSNLTFESSDKTINVQTTETVLPDSSKEIIYILEQINAENEMFSKKTENDNSPPETISSSKVIANENETVINSIQENIVNKTYIQVNMPEAVDQNETVERIEHNIQNQDVMPMDINESVCEYKPLPDIINQTIAMSSAENLEITTSVPETEVPEQVESNQENIYNKSDEPISTEVIIDSNEIKLQTTNVVVSEIVESQSIIPCAEGIVSKQETNEITAPCNVETGVAINVTDILETKDSDPSENIVSETDKTCKAVEIEEVTENKNVHEVEEEIVLSENNSPFVSVIADNISEDKPEGNKDEMVDHSLAVKSEEVPRSSSPPIRSKGYNFNFDDMDFDPFATKTKIRPSPPIDSPNKNVEPKAQAKLVEKPVHKKDVNRRKSQPDRRRPTASKRKFNSTFDGAVSDKVIEKPSEILETCAIGDIQLASPATIALSPNNVTIKEKENNETVEISIKTDKKEILEKETDIISEGKIEQPIEVSSEIESNVEANVNDIKVTSSSELSTYFSAGTSSSGSSMPSKNVFNLPEIDDMNFNPFATKSKMRQSRSPSLDLENPFATKSNIKSSPDSSVVISHNDGVVGPTEEKVDSEAMEKDASGNLSNTTISSKATDEKNITSKEINTEDEDTIEGPFLDADDLHPANKVPDFAGDNIDMMQFHELPTRSNEDNLDTGEMFIDAEAFEFLLNQNKSNTIVDSGKESLFLKFDPLFAKRMSAVTSDGVVASLARLQKRQSTPTKTVRTPPKNTSSPVAGPSNLNEAQNMDMNVSEEFNDDLNITVSKPMMVVPPAVNPVTPRNKSLTPNRSNRRSITFTSPAMAVIDRLLSLSGNNSLIHDTTVTQVSREQAEADIALSQLRELLAEKEINVYNLRSESNDLRDRLSTLEGHVKNLEAASQDKLRKINQLTNTLAEKTKINKSMAAVVEEYERTIASLIAETAQDKKKHDEERIKLINERDEQTAHLASMEVSFSDLHSKYEKSKQIILNCKANEDSYKKSIKEFAENLTKMQNNYELLKQHATSKLNHANQELEKINRSHEAEVLKLNAMIKRKELHITSLEESLTQKTKANEELTAICDELINKVG